MNCKRNLLFISQTHICVAARLAEIYSESTGRKTQEKIIKIYQNGLLVATNNNVYHSRFNEVYSSQKGGKGALVFGQELDSEYDVSWTGPTSISTYGFDGNQSFR